MSYILDALKKAETERNLGEIPGIYAQPLHLAADAPKRTWRHDPWRWLALACIALLLGLGVWKWWPAGGEQTRQPIAPVAPKAPVAPVPRSAPRPSPAVQATPAPTSAPAPVTAKAPVRDEAPVAKSPRKKERHAKHSDRVAQAKPSLPKAAAEPPISDMRDLPLSVQREIPELTIGGYIYSGAPSDRSVLINQRLLREGDQISPGLTLEGIRPDGIVLDYRGRRFSKPY